MYESPVELIFSEIKAELIKRENEVLVRAVQGIVPNVTEEELVKALQYDRGQYTKGFLDGRNARDAEILRCKDCKHCEHWYADKGRCFLWHEDGIDVFEDGFCSYAERREDEE